MATIFTVRRTVGDQPIEYKFYIRQVDTADPTGILERSYGTPLDAVTSRLKWAQRVLKEAQEDVDALQMMVDDPEWLRERTMQQP